MKTKPLNTKESVSILKNLMLNMGYKKQEIDQFIKKNKIGKERIMVKPS